MSHPEQLAFFRAFSRRNPSLVEGATVLEVGAYDVNGSVREVFAKADTFVGVDLTPGPGVDLVAFGHEVDHASGSYDITVSGECFEHDPHWRSTLQNMARMTRPGGVVIFTCASHGRPEHGTRRSDISDSPGTQAEGLDYYRNLVATDFADLPLDEWFGDHKFWTMPTTFDLYFIGVRPGGSEKVTFPTESDLDDIKAMLPKLHRAARIPLRTLAALVKDEERYQRIIMPYWLFLLRRSGSFHRAARS